MSRGFSSWPASAALARKTTSAQRDKHPPSDCKPPRHHQYVSNALNSTEYNAV
jgi:hypothetical protein